MISYYIGVDVGTGSARAGLFNAEGRCLGKANQDIVLNNPLPNHYEQSSEDIWEAVCNCVKKVVQSSGIDPILIKGIGFDATCSLVALDENGETVSISTTREPKWNVMMWMDHRADRQAAQANRTHHDVLKYVGGKISLEMETPKLMWLKENLPESYNTANHFFDLPDFLTYKATGSLTRSLCSLVCKWTYMAKTLEGEGQGWSDSYWREIGLGDIVDDGYKRVGTNVLKPGQPIEGGLCEEAAVKFGLRRGVSVGVSMIDAHAGALGVMGGDLEHESELSQRLAVIAGTSSCHMALNSKGIYVGGVWGPYYGAVLDNYWLSEGGQSATGKLIDHLVKGHSGYGELEIDSKRANKNVYEYLNDYLHTMAKEQNVKIDKLSSGIHVLPYFHGNRSPHADPTLRGSVIGLSLTNNIDSLALLYLATVQSLAYGTRDIVQSMNQSGHTIKSIFMCGGLSKNDLYVATHANATGLPVVISQEEDSVLLGSAVLGAAVSGDFVTIQDAMQAMTHQSETITPDSTIVNYHTAKYAVFTEMRNHQLKCRTLMQDCI